MRCECKECNGNGEITCPECDGKGWEEGDILDMRLDKNIKHYNELFELQKDAKRVTKQAERLTELKPSFQHSYYRQLQSALQAIKTEADEIADLK